MNKMNKKGFTLIEMLVVIAIIAVLVAIIIPTISSATTKANAAADAANLRSLIAEATTDYLSGTADETGMVQFDGDKTFTAIANKSPAPKSKGETATAATIELGADGKITARFDEGHDVAYFAYIAEHGEAEN